MSSPIPPLPSFPVSPDLERRHPRPDGHDGPWFEVHRLDVFLAGGIGPAVGPASISAVVEAEPARGRVWFTAVVLRPGVDPVVVSADDIVLPAGGWELRTSGLWADHVCESALDHWSYGLEAFGLALDDPDALLGRALGERVPLGWELEFEAGAEARWLHHAVGYTQTGVGHGLLLDRDGSHPVEGPARRVHWWGYLAPRSFGVGPTVIAENPGGAEAPGPVDWAGPKTVVTPGRTGVTDYFVGAEGLSVVRRDADS